MVVHTCDHNTLRGYGKKIMSLRQPNTQLYSKIFSQNDKENIDMYFLMFIYYTGLVLSVL